MILQAIIIILLFITIKKIMSLQEKIQAEFNKVHNDALGARASLIYIMGQFSEAMQMIVVNGNFDTETRNIIDAKISDVSYQISQFATGIANAQSTADTANATANEVAAEITGVDNINYESVDTDISDEMESIFNETPDSAEPLGSLETPVSEPSAL